MASENDVAARYARLAATDAEGAARQLLRRLARCAPAPVL